MPWNAEKELWSVNTMIDLLNDNVHYIIISLFSVNDFIIFCKILIILFTNLGLKDFFDKMLIHKEDPTWATNHKVILSKFVYRPYTYESGLPSEHCMVIFSVIPPLMKIYHPYTIMLMIMYGIFICYDRVRKENNTYIQVIIGSLVGWGMGLILFN